MSILNRGGNLSINESLGNKPDSLIFTAGYEDKQDQTLIVDLAVILLDENNKPRNAFDFFYYGLAARQNKSYGSGYISLDGSLKNLGKDNLSGNSKEQQIIIDFDKIDPEINKLVMFYNIFDSANKRQDFSMIDNPYFRLSTMPPNEQIIASFSNNQKERIQSMELCHIYRYKNEWKIRAQGVGYNQDTRTVLKEKYSFEF